MGNVRELLTGLGPRSASLDPDSDGQRRASSQEIAAALAFVPGGLGREILEACWWPESGAMRRLRLRDAILALVEPELRRQHEMLSRARTALGLAEVCLAWGAVKTPEQRRARDLAAAALEVTKAQCWPTSTFDSLPTLVASILVEISSPSPCRSCDGAGKRQAGIHLLVCPECAGSGQGEVSDRKRAAAIGRDESTYRAKWRAPYQWLFDRMKEAEEEAASALAKALGHAAA